MYLYKKIFKAFGHISNMPLRVFYLKPGTNLNDLLVETRHGQLVVADAFITTVPGFYVGDVLPRYLQPGTAAVVVKTVPPGMQIELSHLLFQAGRREPFHFWSGLGEDFSPRPHQDKIAI